MPTLYEIAKTIRRPEDLNGRAAHKASPSIADGIRPATPRLEEGTAWLSPAELLAIEVPVLSLNGSITGYQREKIDNHVRAMARAMRQGKPFPAATIGMDENGVPAFTDGQHRALAAVMAGVRLRVDVRQLTTAEQRALFAGQRRAKSVAKSVLVLAGSDPISTYVQDAFTSPTSPWEGLIGENGRGGQISAASLFDLVVNYAGNILSEGHSTGKADARFSPEAADELSLLLRAFGTPQTNPAAFAAMPRRAITQAAVFIVMRRGRRPEDIKRWMRHMPKFPFAEFPHIRSARHLRAELIRHWNKRLSEDQRVSDP